MPADDASRECDDCGAKCCRYVAVQIDAPSTPADWDDIRWYVAHEKMSVFIEGGEWHLQFDAACQYVTPDGRCAIHDHKPRICSEHPASECENADGELERIELHTPTDVEDFRTRRYHRA